MNRFNESDPAFQAVRLVEVELTKPLQAISAYVNDLHYGRAQILVRLHTYPIGHIKVALGTDGLSSQALATRIWDALRAEINTWLTANGLATISQLGADGLEETAAQPSLLLERRQVLENAPFISVVLCTRDRTQFMRTALQRLLVMSYPNFEIIVVDNAPRTEATADLIKSEFSTVKNIRYVREDRPGLSIARNCGLVEAKGELVAYIDDDAIADPNWLTEAARAFNVSNRVACVTGATLPTELDTPVQMLGEQFRGRDMMFSRIIFDKNSHKTQDPLYPWAAGIYGGGGANMTFRTSILREVGGFDPALGTGTPTHGGEDLAIFVDLVKRDYQLIYDPGVIVYHAHRSEYDALLKQLYGYGVGLTAFLMHFIVKQPANLFDILPKMGRAVYYMLNSNSNKNHKRTASYPAELSRAELRGMVFGPMAYLRSRRLMSEYRIP